MAQLVVAVAGAAIGSAFGAPGIGFAIGSAIGGALFAPSVQGPRLQDLKATALEYGAVVPLVYGHPRVPGIVAWSSEKIEVKESEGKGGPSATSYTYKQHILYKLSCNECDGVRKIWKDGKLIWTKADDATDESIANSADVDDWESIEFFTGDSAQDPWTVYEAAVGVGLAPAMRGQFTVGITGLSLGSSGYAPQLTFELARNGTVTQSQDGLFFDAPFTLDGSDVGPSPAATQTDTAGPGTSISYSGGLATFTRTNSDSVNSIYGGTKLEPSLTTYSQVTVEARGVTINAYNALSGSASGGRFLIVDQGASSDQYSFGFYCDGGAPTLYASVIYTPSGSSTTNFGLAPTSANYKIVRDGYTNTVNWYVDDVLVKTVSGSATYKPGRLFIGLANVASYNQSVTSMSVSRVMSYWDDYVEVDTTRVSATPDSLQFVLEDLSLRCGLEEGYTDASACSGIDVHALAVTQVTPARTVIEGTLMPAYNFSCYEDDGLVYVLRGGSSIASPAYDDLGAVEGEPGGNPLPIVDRTDLETPAQVAITSSNILNDYQTDTKYSDRLIGPATGVSKIELALGLTPQEGKRIADIQLRRATLARRQIGPVGLTRYWSKLRPTDLVTFTDADGRTYLGFVTKITDSGPVRTLDLEYEDASVWVSTALADESSASSGTVTAVELTSAEYIDMPILRDSDNDAGAYVAVAPATTVGSWPGCSILRGLDDTAYLKLLDVTDRAIVGVTTTALGAWDGIYASDEKNTVTVTLNAAASSYTDDAIINGTAPLWLIGDEYLYARTATLVTGTTYTLSGLYRARRGSASGASTHAIGDRVVLMRTTGLRRLPMENGQLGVEFSYKAVTFGKATTTATEDLFTDNGVGLKPFAPVHLVANSAGGGTYAVTWTRRTRLSCRFTGSLGINTPLGETTESYAVDVWNGSTVTSTQTVTSAAATVTASAGNTVRVYQLSSIVGRGFVAEIVL